MAIYYKDPLNGIYGKYCQNDVDTTYDVYMKMNEVQSVCRETAERSARMNYDIRNHIKKVKFNPPATIVFWTDNTKTVVKAENEDYDPEKGLAMCICKKTLGNKGNYYEVFKKWLPKEDDSDVVQKVLEHIKPQTFEFELKPIDINQRLFEVFTGVAGAATSKFDTKEKPEPAKKSVGKAKEESESHSCQWVPKDE